MSKLKVLDLFSGIGGFSLGLERTGGFETVAFCEIEDFPRRVLKKHWPKVPIYEDVTKLTGDILRRDGISVDVITGGFPCQDISVAGKQAGIGEETRSGLWSEIVRLISDLSPRFVIVENVAALLSGPTERRGSWFGRILGDLAKCGYNAEWRVIPACYVGAWHKRARVWIFAYPNLLRCKRLPEEQIFRFFDYEKQYSGIFEKWPGRPNLSKPGTVDGSNGLSKKLVGLGNAVVPQIPELLGHAILDSISAGKIRG
jgi:DNA (cytosine-5)-methyltransferase 1